MKPLLHEIARYYVGKDAHALANYCFIFPNKRSGIFFSHYLAIEADRAGLPLIHPEIITISDFVAEVSESIEASRIEQLFIMYRCYREVLEKNSAANGSETPVEVDFNKFRYWGDVLLSDFTDVDKYLVDPAELFHNIESLREISANYLTPEQIEVIKRYWGEEKAPHCVSEFWNHAVHVNDTNVQSQRKSTTAFIKLWQVMNELYTSFNSALEQRGLAYQGMMYRKALKRIEQQSADDFPYNRYVFIGFNVLSTAEERIFASMRDKGIADFFWDYASPAFKDGDNRASRFLKRYVEQFKQPDDAGNIGAMYDTWPQIEVIAVPSTNGQTKVIPEILKTLPVEARMKSPMSTAIVLPDENLCMPVLNSLPSEIGEINITMGYQLRNTPVAGLMSLVTTMQLNSQRLNFENAFYREDVIALLSHPIIRSIDSALCDKIVLAIVDKRYISVPQSLLMSSEFEKLHPLFHIVGNKQSVREVFAFLRRLVTWLLDTVYAQYSMMLTPEEQEEEATHDDCIPSPSLNAAGAMEAGFLLHYLNAIDELQRLQRQHLDDLKVDMNDASVFGLVERLIAGETVRFEGKPLKGLQIMGVLETRVLDFDNVIMPSINERIFPRKHFSNSFIPPALRRGYGMSTLDHQESISAYYFYRLLTRAKRVYLLYDSRTEGVKSGEPSRYINQLKYLYRPDGMTWQTAFYNLRIKDNPQVTLPRSQFRDYKLHSYVDTIHPRYMSASSINRYINCPLQFALSYIEGYFDNDESKDFFDEATFGSVLHRVVERLYSSQQVNGQPVVIDNAIIKKLNRREVIDPEIKKAINYYYLKRDENDNAPLTADAEIISRIMYEMVSNMLAHELDFIDSFTFISGEKAQQVRLKISDRLTINFSYTIDRIDEIRLPDGRRVVRIIDYKTGSDDVDTTIDGMFKATATKMRNKAILQLFLYCNAYVQNTPGLDDSTLVQPMIYKFRTIGQNRPPEPLIVEKQVLQDFRMFNDRVLERLDNILYPLLYDTADDAVESFKAVEDDEHACKYCKFTTVCLRQVSNE